MSKYLLDKFLFTVDRDAELVGPASLSPVRKHVSRRDAAGGQHYGRV